MLSRTEPFFSKAAFERLRSARVIIFGLGGVGSWAAECLVRTGVRRLTIVDFDTVAASNVNRQLQATAMTIGLPKASALRDRLLSIAPDAEITAIDGRYDEQTAPEFDIAGYDYVIDAIDSVADKARLILEAASCPSTVLFSSMGAAMRVDPGKVKVTEFLKVTGCPLARALRQRFKKSGVFPRRKFKAVYSDEQAVAIPPGVKGSLCQVTAVFGMTLASLVINDIRDRQ